MMNIYNLIIEINPFDNETDNSFFIAEEIVVKEKELSPFFQLLDKLDLSPSSRSLDKIFAEISEKN